MAMRVEETLEGMRELLGCALVAALLLLPVSARAQTPSRSYLPDAADEDWSFLKDAPRIDRWDRVKYIPLGREDWFVTLSGEVRYRLEGFRVRETASQPGTIDNYLLQRYLVGADVRFGPRGRFFVELQSGIVNGKLRSPRPSDRNSLDLHQAFVELRPPASEDRRVTVKVGRQALAVGSTRLISASPGPQREAELRRCRRHLSHPLVDAGRRGRAAGGTARAESSTIDPLRGNGSGESRRAGAVPASSADSSATYYLGLDRTFSLYAQGGGPERRHTIGLKWTGDGARVNLNYDALAQWGELGGSSIRAWAVRHRNRTAARVHRLATTPERARRCRLGRRRSHGPATAGIQSALSGELILRHRRTARADEPLGSDAGTQGQAMADAQLTLRGAELLAHVDRRWRLRHRPAAAHSARGRRGPIRRNESGDRRRLASDAALADAGCGDAISGRRLPREHLRVDRVRFLLGQRRLSVLRRARRRHCTGFHGVRVVERHGLARAVVSAPRSFSWTMPSWLTTKVMTPVTSYSAGQATSAKPPDISPLAM